jgi:hypothetical protein
VIAAALRNPAETSVRRDLSAGQEQFGYGNISISGNRTLTLSPGTYNVNSLKLSGNSVVTVSPAGPVIINFSGATIFAERAVPSSLVISRID